MAVYPPPNFTEYISTFNPENWVADDTGAIDTNFLDDNYAKYPVIQGTNYTLKNTLVQGDLVISNTQDKLTFADNDADGGLVIGTANTAPTCNTQSSIIIGRNAGRYLNNNVFACTAVGTTALSNDNQTSTGNTEYYNTAIGSASLQKVVNSDNNTIANTGCGYSTLNHLLTGNNNTGVGSQSGAPSTSTQRLLNGSNNTFLGAKSGVATALSGSCSHSTAVGADALIEFSNSIQLGTVSDFVNIPNYIRFSDGTTQATAGGGGGNIGLVNIQTFGAVGNGVFDCTTAINNAIATLTSGSVLYIPQGNYLVSGQLTFSGLVNSGIFCQGTLQVGTNNNFTVVYISNVNNFSINGCLRITNTAQTGITGIKVDNVAGLVVQFNLLGANLTNLNVGMFIASGGFNARTFANITIKDCATGIDCRGEYNLFTSVNVTNATYGIINYGGNNEYNGGMIVACDYGLIVAYVPAVVGNADHNGIFNFTINHCTRMAITLIYISLTWCISNCTIYANNGDSNTIGNPLSLVPAGYQGLVAPAVYIQGASRVNISNCVLGFNEVSLMLNGVTDSNISSNVFLQTLDTKYITINGVTTYGENTGNIISNNVFSGLTETTQRIEITNAVDATTLGKTSNNVINNNSGGLNLVNLNNTGSPTTVYIDGTEPFYNLYEQSVDTIYLANVTNGSQFTINFIRTGIYNYTVAPTYKDIILLNTGLGGTNTAPVICNGLEYIVAGSVRTIRFHQEGQYIFQPSQNSVKNNSGYYTIYPVTKDPHLYFNAPLDATNLLDFSSPLYYNTVLNISGTGNNSINLPPPNFSTGGQFSYAGSTLQIFNNTAGSLSLYRPALTGLFLGAYGNGASSIVLPDNAWYLITFDGTNYLINERSADITYSFTGLGSTADFSTSFNLTNATVRFATTSPTVGSTITWMLPTAQQCKTTTSRIINVGTTQLTLSLGSTNFLGKYGSTATTLIIPVNTWVELFSNGSNWQVQDRSENFNNTAITTVSTTTNLTARFDFTNAFLYLNPTVNNPTVDIPIPSSAQTGKIYTIENISSTNPLTLQISSGVFTGAFGSEATTLILPSNSRIGFYSNGTNWVCNCVSDYGWTYPIANTGLVIQLQYQWFRNYLNLSTTAGNTLSVRLPTTKPLYYQEGLLISTRRIQGTTSATTPMNVVTGPLSSSTNTLYINGGTNGSNANYPLTGLTTLSPANLSTLFFRIIQTSVGGSGTCEVSLSNPKLIYLNPTVGSFSIGTVITVGGANYTIRGCASASGTCSGTAGATTFTALSVAPGFGSYLTVGMIITVAGATTHTITNITFSSAFPATNAYPTYTPSNVIFTPAVPAGGWSTASFNATTFGAYAGGQFGAGVYHLDNPVVATSATTYTSESNYSYNLYTT